MRRVLGLALAVTLTLSAATAHARPCPVPDGASPALATIDGEARLEFLRAGMRKAARDARVWAWSSVGALLFAASFQLLGATHVPDRDSEIDLYAGSITVLYGVAQIAAVPPLVTIDQWTIDSHIAHAPPDADRCALLAEAERLLARDARSELRATGPVMHAVTILFNIGVSLTLGIAFGHWETAAINLFAGTATNELQVLTEPTGSVKLEARYRAGDLAAPKKEEKHALRWRVTPTLGPDRAGMAFGIAF